MSQNAGSYDREMNNIADVPTSMAAFQREWIDYALQNEYYSAASIRHLFIVVDPSSGKDGNYYAITSMIFVRGTCVVCPYIIPICIQHVTHRLIILSILIDSSSSLFDK